MKEQADIDAALKSQIGETENFKTAMLKLCHENRLAVISAAVILLPILLVLGAGAVATLVVLKKKNGKNKKSENKKYYIIKKYCTSKRNTQRFGSAK